MYQYQLQRYHGAASRYRCPACQHRRKTFTLYINTQTNISLSPAVGKCDREIKCGYHYTPKQYFEREGSSWLIDHSKKIHSPWLINHSKRASGSDHEPSTMNHEPTPPSTINHQLFQASLARYDQNNLVEFLKLSFGDAVARGLVERYHIGTSKHWPGATVFWQVDLLGNIRTGKIMLYNPTNGKRVKKPFNHITWVHKVVNGERAVVNGEGAERNSLTINDHHSLLTNFNLQQCFFGEHLLHGNTLPVAITESEKSALVASIYMPAYVWLASGSLSNLNEQKCNVLKGRQVLLFPDLNAYQTWQAKALQLAHITRFTVSTLLEQTATAAHKAQGLDIADYLLGG